MQIIPGLVFLDVYTCTCTCFLRGGREVGYRGPFSIQDVFPWQPATLKGRKSQRRKRVGQLRVHVLNVM